MYTGELISTQIYLLLEILSWTVQKKSFVLHQNQVSSCKGYGYWFKKFKDFPCLSELWWCTLSVATFRPTLDSTFGVITTRLGRSSWWSPVHPVHISSFLLMTPWCWLLYLCSISCLHHRYQPAVDRRQHVASAHNGSKASLTLCSPQQWLMAAAANLRATDVRSRCSMSLIPAPGSLLPLSLENQIYSGSIVFGNLGITKIRKVSLHLAEEMNLVFSISWWEATKFW